MTPSTDTAQVLLDETLEWIAAGSEAIDRDPRFPAEAFDALREAGVLKATIGSIRAEKSVRTEWKLVRRVSAADASVGRILDGHFNAVERLEVAADPASRDAELEMVKSEGRLLGVWGADPGSDEGEPARIHESEGMSRIKGVKTFCSGAGGVDSALVMVGNDLGDPARLVLVDCDRRVETDRSWYRAAGLRASESHRVDFHDAPVVAMIGEPGELVREPWFSRDALRTASSWAGMIDAAADAALEDLGERRSSETVSQLAAGQIEAARGTVDASIETAIRAVDSGEDLNAMSVLLRVEIDRAARTVLESAAMACGSHPFVTGGPLDRARRNLETFLLQHRLNPMLVKLGGRMLAPE